MFTGMACRLDTWSRDDGGSQALHGRARVWAGRRDPPGYPISRPSRCVVEDVVKEFAFRFVQKDGPAIWRNPS